MFTAIHNEMTRAEVGVYGERQAIRFFRSHGLKAFHPKKRQCGDIIITGGVRVEVKTSTLNKDNRYTATLYKVRRGTVEQNYHHADYVYFQCVGLHGSLVCYMIPVTALGKRSTLKIGAAHKTQFAKYRIG